MSLLAIYIVVLSLAQYHLIDLPIDAYEHNFHLGVWGESLLLGTLLFIELFNNFLEIYKKWFEFHNCAGNSQRASTMEINRFHDCVS